MISINNVIKWNDEIIGNVIERVLYIERNRKRIVLIDVTNLQKTFPVWRSVCDIEDAIRGGRAEKLESDNYMCTLLPEDFIDGSDKGKKKAERYREYINSAWEVIKDLVDCEPVIYSQYDRGRLIRDVMKEQNVSKNTVYKYLRRYWIGGKSRLALMPEYQKCGAKGEKRISTEGKKLGRPRGVAVEFPHLIGVNVTEEDKKIFKAAVALFYDDTQKRSLQFTYNEMRKAFYNEKLELENGVMETILKPHYKVPNKEQFQYWFNTKVNPAHSILAREGETKYQMNYRPLLRTSTDQAFGPGDLYQIDATIADVYLVSSFDRSRIIGRPTVYLVADVFSHMVVGMNVTLNNASWLSASVALENAFTSKREYCSLYQKDIPEEIWPCHHLPKAIIGDRGEMESYNADNLADLGIDIKNTAPWRADLKGIIEQLFHILNEKAGEFIPGFAKKIYQVRGGPEYRLDARLTLPAFIKCLIELVLIHNNCSFLKVYPATRAMIADKLPLIPVHIWNWGIKNKSGGLSERPREVIRRYLMPRGEASVTDAGILFKGMYYHCDEASQRGWYLRSKLKGAWKIQISYDPRCMDNIFIDKNKCTLLQKSRRFQGLSMEEVLEMQHVEKVIQVMATSDTEQEKARRETINQATVDEEEEKTIAEIDSLASKSQRLGGINKNHADEKRAFNKMEAWTREDSTAPETITLDPTLLEPEKKETLEEVAIKNSHISILRKLTEG